MIQYIVMTTFNFYGACKFGNVIGDTTAATTTKLADCHFRHAVLNSLL